MKKDTTQIKVYGCEITLHFCHMDEPNHIPQKVEQMLLAVGLPKDTMQEISAEKSA